MEAPPSALPAAPPLALDLALTIRHDGRGGVADDLGDSAGLTAWVQRRPDVFGSVPGAERGTADSATLGQVRELRAALRALFARAVRPAAPSPADADRLMSVPDALAVLNAAARRVPTVPVLRWPEGDRPAARHLPAAPADPGDLVLATLASAAADFLTGPDLARLRACHAPRCVRYFLKDHPRQEWCKPSCGNRARVARHHERHRAAG
ncbi:CGNR zinc finger domain-containing protein [Streptomyces uncialis]|uniref:CGNR zinc finger domain-containing protein n=1 Tax=Streptomyces uncialis TaxID=1048205 RepID=UPI0038205FEA